MVGKNSGTVSPTTGNGPKPFYIFNLANTSRVGTWVVARDVDEAMEFYLACGRAKDAKNVTVRDVTDSFASNPNYAHQLPQFLATQTEVAQLVIELPSARARGTITEAARDAAIQNRRRLTASRTMLNA